ncbi:MAG: hypothetical protein WCA07_17500 [Gloeobacterales cyanobacterium]
MSNPTVVLLELRQHYQSILAQSESQAVQAKAHLAHVEALLLDGLLQELPAPETTIAPSELPSLPALALTAVPPTAAIAVAPTSAPKPSRLPKAKAAPEPAPVSGKRSPRPLLPAYQGLTRGEAIAQLLQATPGQEVTADGISESLFGKLSATDHKAERKSLNTQLYKGQSKKLWQKGTAPGTFTIDASTPSASVQPTPKAPATKAKTPAKTPATTAAQRKSLTLLPAYAELTKREAIAQVLTAASGEVLHQDTIIKSLYGDLSPEELKEERVRIKTALLTGVKDQKWQKATAPSSYLIKTTGASAKPKRPGRKPEPSKEPKPKPVAEVVEAIIPAAAAESAPRAAKSRTSLTLLPAFEGLSKREAIAQVLEQYSGEVLHQDTIIQTLYGDLSIADLKAERSRMDTALRTGVKDQKWQKASVPASYVMATATNAKAAKPKAAKKAARPERTEAELLEILQKADIQV